MSAAMLRMERREGSSRPRSSQSRTQMITGVVARKTINVSTLAYLCQVRVRVWVRVWVRVRVRVRVKMRLKACEGEGAGRVRANRF
tara:strand:- start:700 stop:957 length:258 start_codon:yes stop_codon:yes gene_type:complete